MYKKILLVIKMYYNRLREIREDKSLTQSDIAKVLNTTQQQYSKYELGIQVLPLEKINILANYYKLL